MNYPAHMTGPRGLDEALRFNRTALARGGKRTAALTTEWDIAGTGKLRCLHPVRTTNVYRQGDDDWLLGLPPDRANQYADITARCRVCDNCLKLRGYEWKQRMQRETLMWPRSWWGTVTLAPYHHDRARNLARLRASRNGQRYDGLSEGERFSYLTDVIGEWITTYQKRVREAATGPVRLVFVAEKHKSGLPHYHAIWHECQLGALSERLLSRRWGLGFTQWRVVRTAESAAGYVAKYLTKSLLARVRASKAYGSLELTTHRPVQGIASDPDNALMQRERREREASDQEGAALRTEARGSIPRASVSSSPLPAGDRP